MKCAEVTKFVYVYLDGEFEPRECAEFEEHVRNCDECRRTLAFERAFHGLLRSRVDRPTAPPHLRDRVLQALDRAEEERPGLGGWLTRLPAGAKAVPAFMAAALAVFLLWPRLDSGNAAGDTDATVKTAGVTPGAVATAGVVPGRALSGRTSGTPVGDLMTAAAAVHEVALPSEVKGDAHAIAQFADGKVPFQAHPPFLDSPQIHLVGARQTHLGGRPAVIYTYQYKGKRLTVAQFAEAKEPERFRRAVFTDRRGKYNIVLVRDHERGLTSSVVSDVDEGDLLRLVPASLQR